MPERIVPILTLQETTKLRPELLSQAFDSLTTEVWQTLAIYPRNSIRFWDINFFDLDAPNINGTQDSAMEVG